MNFFYLVFLILPYTIYLQYYSNSFLTTEKVSHWFKYNILSLPPGHLLYGVLLNFVQKVIIKLIHIINIEEIT